MKKLSLILAMLLALLPILAQAEETVPSADPADAEALYQQGLAFTEGDEPDFEKAQECFLKAAELGNDDAMHQLGNHHYYGRFTNGVPDYEAARQWFEKAAAAGNVKSMNNLGVIYNSGHCNDNVPDHENARKWYLKAAELGLSMSMYNLGKHYANGNFNNGTPDGETALNYYMQAWNTGYSKAEKQIIDLLYEGITAEDGTVLFAPNHAQMLDFLNQMDQQGTENTYALSWLGWLLCDNSDQNVCEADYDRALEVFTRGAELGDAYCMMQLGTNYENGYFCDGVADYEAARGWYEKSAAAGSHQAAYNLGQGYENGNLNYGIPNGEMALSYYMQAWNAGYSDAEGSIIGLLYEGIAAEDGTVLFASDHTQMLEFLNQLDQQGTNNTYALSWLGWLLCGNSDQNVCEKDYARAVEIFTRGAELGDAYCMMQLGSIYEAGQLGEVDLSIAEKWFAKAVEAGDPTAQDALDRVRNLQTQ